MPQIKVLVTQTGVDTLTSVPIETNISVDSKMGWGITGMRAWWADGSGVVAADYQVNAILSTVPALTLPMDDDEIVRIAWGLQNTGGVAVAVPYEPIKAAIFDGIRVTAQPLLFATIMSTATGQANDVVFIINYDLVRLTDVELLRLLVGGA